MTRRGLAAVVVAEASYEAPLRVTPLRVTPLRVTPLRAMPLLVVRLDGLWIGQQAVV